MGIQSPVPMPTLNLNAKAYGARFDGSTDDTTALQAAIDAAYALGGAVIDCPAGTAMVSVLDVKNHVYLRGRGPRTTKIKRKSGLGASANPVVRPHVSSDAGATDPNAEHWGLLDLEIDGNKSAYSGQAVGTYHCLYLDTSPQATKGAADDSLEPRGFISNVRFVNARGSGVGVAQPSRAAHRFVNVVAEGNDQYGIMVGQDSHYSLCSSVGNGLHGWYAWSVSGFTLAGCKAITSGQSYVGIGATTAPNGAGFYFATCTAGTATGCSAVDNQGAGFAIDSASAGIVIEGLIADTNSRVTAGAHPGVDLWNSDSCQVRGVCSDRNPSSVSWQRNALQVRTTSDMNQIELEFVALNGATLSTPLRSAIGGNANRISINGEDCSQGEVISWAATVTPDPFLGSVKFVTLAGATTIAAPAQTFHPPGAVLTFILTQDATGGRVVSWNAAYKVVGFQPSLAANAVSVATFIFDGTNWQQITGTHPAHLGGRAVATTGPTNGQALAWNSASQQWEPQTIAGGGGGGLSGYKIVTAYGATGDGTTDDAAAIQAAITAAVSGEVVWVPPGVYRLSVPVTMKTGVTLRGTHGARWVYNLPSVTGPCVFKAGSSWSGTGLIKGDATAADITEVRIQSLSLHGNEQASHGVHMVGACLGWMIEDVNITALSETGGNVSGSDAAGIRTNNATRSSVSVFPKGLVLRRVWSYSNCRGFSLNNTTDVQIDDCGAQDNAKDGWFFGACAMVAGRSVNALFNRNRGIEIANSGTDQIDLHVITDRNEFDGVRVNTVAGGVVSIRGITRRDGRNGNAGGGGYAGVALKSCGPVFVDVQQQVGVDDGAVSAGGESPAYGISCDTVTNGSIGGLLRGVTNPVRDVGSNVSVYVREGTVAQNGSKFSGTTTTVSALNGVTTLVFQDLARTGAITVLSSDPVDATMPLPFDGQLAFNSASPMIWVRVAGAWVPSLTLADASHSDLANLDANDHPQYLPFTWDHGFGTCLPKDAITNFTATANQIRLGRCRIPETGYIRDVAAYLITNVAGNYALAIYDAGEANTTSYKRLWSSGSKTIPATDSWAVQDPGAGTVHVTAGQQVFLALVSDVAAVWAKPSSTSNSKIHQTPNSNFNAGVLKDKQAMSLTASFPPPDPITDASVTLSTTIPFIIARISPT